MCVTYQAAVDHLLALGFELKAGKFFLEGIRLLAAELGNPQDASPVILIAGTNGKGSTAAMLESILRASGYRVGLYTSPHLERVNERIRVDGVDISDDDFASSFEVASAAIERLLSAGVLEKHPSFFECVTAMAWIQFQRCNCDVQVLEVGMGGRLDATNITHPVVSVITPVDFDHQAYLGETLELIAAEKAGIIKDNGVVVSAPQHPIVAEVIATIAADRGAQLVDAGDPLHGVELSLIGVHQEQNAATALAVIHVLRAIDLVAPGGGDLKRWSLPDDAIRKGLATARWPGRLERVADHPATYLDGAHNPAGARVLRDFLETTAHPRVLVFGAMRDKAIGEITATLFPHVDAVVLTQPSHPRAATPEELQATLRAAAHEYTYLQPSPAEALDLASRIAGVDGTVVVGGSLFLVGDLRSGGSRS